MNKIAQPCPAPPAPAALSAGEAVPSLSASPAPLTLVFAKPPSTNTLYANVPGKGRVKSGVYKRWINEAGWQINQQGVRRFLRRVRLSIVIGPRNPRADCSNYIKPTEDLLVRHQIIVDDKHVDRVSIEWGDVRGCQVTIEAA